jgi:hypothetical protein
MAMLCSFSSLVCLLYSVSEVAWAVCLVAAEAIGQAQLLLASDQHPETYLWLQDGMDTQRVWGANHTSLPAVPMLATGAALQAALQALLRQEMPPATFIMIDYP